MILSQMITMVSGNIDDVAGNDLIVGWLNAAKNDMAVEVKADFPDIEITSDMSDTFVFPEKYHEIPVLYASAMFKGADGEESAKASLMNQYYTKLQNFTENYSPDPQYRDDEYTQQFTSEIGQTAFTITKMGYNPRYGNLRVFLDGLETEDFELGSGNTFILDTEPSEGTKVTAIWETYPMFEKAPLGWRW